MLDSNTQKALGKKVGTEVSQGSTSIAMMGEKATDVEREFRRLMGERALPDVAVTELMLNEIDFLLVTKTFKKNETASIALRIEAYGNDLLVDIRHFERSQQADKKRQIIAGIPTAIGILSFWTGLGLIALIWGVWMMWFAKSRFPDGSAEYQASQQHYEMVLETMFAALENCDVHARAQLAQQFTVQTV